METKHKFLSNVRLSYVAKFVSLLALPLVFVLTRTLGAERWGLFSLVISILTFLRIIGGSGLGPSTAKHLAGLHGEEGEAKVGPFLAAGLLAQVLIVLVVAAAFWLTAPTIAGFFAEKTLGSALKMGPFLKIGAIILIFFALCEFAKAALQGAQRFDYVGWVTGVEYAGKLAGAAGLVLLGFGLAGALYGFAFGLIAACCTALILFLKLGMRLPSLSGSEWRSLVGYSLPLILTTASFVIYTELDNIMVGYYVGIEAVGVYSAALFLARGVPEVAKPIGQAAGPIIVKLNQLDGDKAAIFAERLIKYVLALFLPISAAIFVLAPNILALAGKDYVAGAPSLRVMSVFILSLSLGVVVTPMLDYLGLAWRRAVWMSVSVSANVVLNFLLIPRIGAVGAAIATAVTHAPYVANNTWVLCRLVGVKASRVLSAVVKIAAAAAAAAAAAYLTLLWAGGLILPLSIGVATYAVVLRATGLFSRPELIEALSDILIPAKAAPVDDVGVLEVKG
ncbi:MAG: oligosaccharide flippase family protein [Actinomycetota bacterium]|nr:oligosaccharide flippase family protein [Actinomycetota bacterium]